MCRSAPWAREIPVHTGGTPQPSSLDPTTSFLTATKLIYAIGAGITAAAGTGLALQWILNSGFGYNPLQSSQHRVPQSCYCSSLPHLCWHWAICAPAASLRDGCHLSGTLSGIEPQFPVTRQSHGRPLPYHQKLIGHKFVLHRTRQ